jgi:hypothetical protein
MAEIDRVLHIRGLKSNCPVLLNGQIGIIEDQGQETLVFGTVAGNKYVPSGFDFNNFKQDILDMIGDTNSLITVNKVIVNAINELVNSGGVGSGSGGTVNYTTYTYTATADNTTSFEIVNNGIYDPTKDYIQLYLKGVMLTPNVDYIISDLDITLSTFTLNNSESIFMLIFKTEEMNGTNLVDGTVEKNKFETSVQVTLTNADKIGDLSTLGTTAKDTIVNSINENTTQLADRLTFLTQLQFKFVYEINGDGSDETTKLQQAFNTGGVKYFPPGNYKITDRLLMADNTIVYFHPNARLYMDSNPNGINLLNAYKKQNITIYNANIDGIYGAGNAAPPIGTIEGQGVTLGFYGCKNIKIYGGRFTANGSGSGNIYFSKCKNCIVDGVYIEKSINGICVDNYYGDNSGPCGDHSENITIINNTVNDLGGRGIAIDLGTNNYEDIFIGNNQLNACAYACISINANGFTIDSNKGNGKRDNGNSTVGTQQSLPTYFGITSELGHFSNGIIINNKFRNIYKIGIKSNYANNIKILNNELKFAISYLNQWDSTIINIQDDTITPDNHYAMLFSYNSGASNGAKNIIIENNYIENLRLMDDTHIEKCILITDSSNNDTIKQDTNVLIEKNIINLYKSKTVIEYYATNQNIYGKIEINDNKITVQNISGTGIQIQPLDSVTLTANKFSGLDTNITLTKANNIQSNNNIHKNFNKAYYFSTGNLTGQINNLIISDVIIGNPSLGNYVFSGTYASNYICNYSDASGTKFIGVGINQIKSSAYPNNIIYRGATAIPTGGYWSNGDLYLWKTVNTTVGQICKVEGVIGTAAFANYITIS